MKKVKLIANPIGKGSNFLRVEVTNAWDNHPAWLSTSNNEEQHAIVRFVSSYTSNKKKYKQMDELLSFLNGKSSKRHIHSILCGVFGRNVKFYFSFEKVLSYMQDVLVLHVKS